MRNIAIIGGGAGGLAAAIAAARGGAHVTVYEQKDAVGKSILVSGNGRCNLSNARMDARVYRNADFVSRSFAALPPRGVLVFFERLGLVMVDGGEGRLYPATNKAQTVLRVLQLALDELDVDVACHRMVKRADPQGGCWALEFMDGSHRRFDAVILAAGGLAPAQLLPDGLPYTRPAGRLCALKTDLESAEGLDKVRARCTVTLLDGRTGAPHAVERGEAQFRSFGLSGIAAFNVSRFAREGDVLRVDLLPEVDLGQLRAAVARRAQRHPWRAAVDLLAGLALEPVAKAVLRQAGCRADMPLPANRAAQVADALKGYRMAVRALDDRHAQVHRGGFAVKSFYPQTLEAHRLPGLHVIGEALDVDGPCGGYNLHWAWTSGLLAGAHAAGVPVRDVLVDQPADKQAGRKADKRSKQSAKPAGKRTGRARA